METLLPILILGFLALFVCGAIFGLTTLLGPRNASKSPVKLSTYECGIKNAEGDARHPFKIHFYLVAVLFLLFDVEAAFFLPWAVIFRESIEKSPVIFFTGVFYMALMALGLAYIFRKNVVRLQ